MGRERITILIVIYNESVEIMLRTLEQIKNFKIIIVDNSQNFNLKKIILNKYKIYKYHIAKKNLGYSRGYNLAFSFCNTEYIFIKNADCFISEENIMKLYHYINNDINCGIVSPVSYDKHGKLSYNAGKLIENVKEKVPLEVQGDVCVESVLGASIFTKSKYFKEAGMFDEDLFIYFSDYDLCKKIYQSRKQIIQLYESKSIHVHGISKVNNLFKKTFLREYYYLLDNLIYLYKNNKTDNVIKKKNKYFIKAISNFFLLRWIKSLKFYSKYLAIKKFEQFSL